MDFTISSNININVIQIINIEYTINDFVSNIFVGTDGKLHKVQGGADTVLPFNSGLSEIYCFSFTASNTMYGVCSKYNPSIKTLDIKASVSYGGTSSSWKVYEDNNIRFDIVVRSNWEYAQVTYKKKGILDDHIINAGSATSHSQYTNFSWTYIITD